MVRAMMVSVANAKLLLLMRLLMMMMMLMMLMMERKPRLDLACHHPFGCLCFRVSL